jgi:hypothetical protein
LGFDTPPAVVGSAGTLYAAADDNTARREFAPYYEATVAARDVPGNAAAHRPPETTRPTVRYRPLFDLSAAPESIGPLPFEKHLEIPRP